MPEDINNYGPRSQIHKYQTNKKLLEFVNKLIPADVNNYGNVHAQGGKGMIPSRIGITLLDYSEGTGDKTKTLKANVSPSDIAYLFMIIKRGDKEFKFEQQKIIAAKKDENGKAPVTKLEIGRAETDRNGNERRLKWYVKITNGTGIPEESSTGGMMCKAGSFVKEKEAFINLSDEDMFKALYETNRFIELWEMANIIPVIKTAQQKIAEVHQ